MPSKSEIHRYRNVHSDSGESVGVRGRQRIIDAATVRSRLTRDQMEKEVNATAGMPDNLRDQAFRTLLNERIIGVRDGYPGCPPEHRVVFISDSRPNGSIHQQSERRAPLLSRALEIFHFRRKRGR